MKNTLYKLGCIICIVSLAMIMVTGCAKKTETTQIPGATSAEQAKAQEAAAAEEAARQQALKEQALKEQQEALKKQLLAEAASFVDIHFDFDKYDLKPEARDILSGLGDWLIAHRDFEIAIEGHCDERGTKEYNLALGERRADSAKNYLVNLGVDGARITTISYGEELPLDPGHTEEAWAKNRRDHFVIYPVNQ